MSKIETKPVRLAWPSVAETLAGLVAELKRQPAYIAQLEAYHRLQADPQARELLQAIPRAAKPTSVLLDR